MTEVKREMNVPVDEVEDSKSDNRNEMMGYQDVSDEFPAKERRKVLFKMDVRIVPMLMLLYCKLQRTRR